MLDGLFDMSELIKRIVKYLVMGLMVALCLFLIPKKSMSIDEIALVALSTACIFSVIDTYLPSFSNSVKTGAGLGVGLQLIGAL